MLNSGRWVDPILQAISRNLWVTGAHLNCDIEFDYIRGEDKKVADLWSRWVDQGNPVASLFYNLNPVPVWFVIIMFVH
jgi:hypothetical protein